MKKQLAKLEAASLGWRGFDDSVSKAKATVILKNMFSPEELLEEPLLAGESAATPSCYTLTWHVVKAWDCMTHVSVHVLQGFSFSTP